jgi:hypothetical protein
LAHRQGVLPPVRIARILAGEGTGQFSSASGGASSSNQRTVPLSVALDYVGDILDESRKEITRLKVSFLIGLFLGRKSVFGSHHSSVVEQSEVEEYNQLCNHMETEVDALLRASLTLPASKGE